MRLCIFGSRTRSPSVEEIINVVDRLCTDKGWPRPTEIISGMAAGVDSAAIAYARAVKLPVVQMPAEWKQHGRSAGFIRNGQMADTAEYFIGFWDGESRGTAQMMRCIASRKKPLHLIVRRIVE